MVAQWAMLLTELAKHLLSMNLIKAEFLQWELKTSILQLQLISTTILVQWGHSPGGRVDDEAVAADDEGEASWK